MPRKSEKQNQMQGHSWDGTHAIVISQVLTFTYQRNPSQPNPGILRCRSELNQILQNWIV